MHTIFVFDKIQWLQCQSIFVEIKRNLKIIAKQKRIGKNIHNNIDTRFSFVQCDVFVNQNMIADD